MLEKAVNGIRNSSMLDTEQETPLLELYSCCSIFKFGFNLVIYKRS